MIAAAALQSTPEGDGTAGGEMIKRSKPVLVPLVLAWTLLSAAGCGESGHHDVITPITTGCVSFEAAAPPSASTVTARQASGSNCDTVIVELVLTDINDVLVLEFEARYDGSLVYYSDYTLSNSNLTSDGQQVGVNVFSRYGVVRFVITRFADTGIDFVGTGSAIQLAFSTACWTEPGAGELTFSETRVLGSENPPQEKPGIQWVGGTIRVD
jgi:hypothetical protein